MTDPNEPPFELGDVEATAARYAAHTLKLEAHLATLLTLSLRYPLDTPEYDALFAARCAITDDITERKRFYEEWRPFVPKPKPKRSATVTNAKITLGGVELSAPAYDAAFAVGLTDANVHTDLDKLIAGRITAPNLLEAYLDGADEHHEQGWRDYVDALEAASLDTRQLARRFGRRIAQTDKEACAQAIAHGELDVAMSGEWTGEHATALANHLRRPVSDLTEAELEAAAEAYVAEVGGLT